MYKEIHIQNFKNFEDIELSNLKRINLIAGKNSVGKSSVLEAIFLHCGAYNPALFFTILTLRGAKPIPPVAYGGGTPWDSFFHKFNTGTPIQISAVDLKYGVRRLTAGLLGPEALRQRRDFVPLPPEQQMSLEPIQQGTYSLELTSTGNEGVTQHYLIADPTGIKQSPIPLPPFPSIFISPRGGGSVNMAKRYSELEVRGEHVRFLQNLKKFEPRIRRLASVLDGSDYTLYADIGLRQMLPLSHVSNGAFLIASFITAIASTKSGVVLIDEFENGIHFSLLKQVWKTLASVARSYDVQLFVTTHSREAIIAAHSAFSETSPYDFTYHRLDQTASGVRVVRYDKSDLETAQDINFEVR